MSNITNVLVLGSTGTTGREVVRALVERGAAVRAATRNPSTATSPTGVEVVQFDPDNADTWPVAFEGIDALYFVLPAFRADEAELGRRIIAAAVDAGVQRIVKLSAAGVDAMPQSGHLQLERAIEASGVDYVHLRPTFFVDNFVNFYGHGVANDGVIALPADDGKTSFIAASDIGDVAAEALLGSATGETWTLTGDESLTHADVAAILSEVLDREVRYANITPEQHIEGMKAHGMPPVGQQVMSALYGFVRAGYTADISPTVEQVLGRKPVTVREWATKHRAAWAALSQAA